MITGIDKFIHRKTEAQQLFHEKISYSITPDDGLWKSEEILLKDGQEFTRWKHFPSGTLERNYPYTEFHPNKNTLENSRFEIQDYVSSGFAYFSLIYCESLNTLNNSYTLHTCKAMCMERQLDSIHSTFSSMRSSYNCILLCEVNLQNS